MARVNVYIISVLMFDVCGVDGFFVALGLCVLWCRVMLDACVQFVVLNWVCGCV